MMDHRCGERFDTRIPALLRINGCWVPALILNASEGGLYAQTTTPIPHHPHSLVEVRLAHRRGMRNHDIPALVIHSHHNGVGLMIVSVEEERWPMPLLMRRHVTTAVGGVVQ